MKYAKTFVTLEPNYTARLEWNLLNVLNYCLLNYLLNFSSSVWKFLLGELRILFPRACTTNWIITLFLAFLLSLTYIIISFQQRFTSKCKCTQLSDLGNYCTVLAFQLWRRQTWLSYCYERNPNCSKYHVLSSFCKSCALSTARTTVQWCILLKGKMLKICHKWRYKRNGITEI